MDSSDELYINICSKRQNWLGVDCSFFLSRLLFSSFLSDFSLFSLWLSEVKDGVVVSIDRQNKTTFLFCLSVETTIPSFIG